MDFNGCSDPNCFVCTLMRKVENLPDPAKQVDVSEVNDADDRVVYSAMWAMLGFDNGPVSAEDVVNPEIMFPLMRRLFQAQQESIRALGESLDIAHDVYLGIRQRLVELEGRLSALENKG